MIRWHHTSIYRVVISIVHNTEIRNVWNEFKCECCQEISSITLEGFSLDSESFLVIKQYIIHPLVPKFGSSGWGPGTEGWRDEMTGNSRVKYLLLRLRFCPFTRTTLPRLDSEGTTRQMDITKVVYRRLLPDGRGGPLSSHPQLRPFFGTSSQSLRSLRSLWHFVSDIYVVL